MKKQFLSLLMMLAPLFAWAQTDISGAKIADFTYQGTGTEAAVVVKLDGTVLTKGTDYTITFADREGTAVSPLRNAGEYTATVTGIGSYTGTKEIDFEVRQAGLTVNLLNATKVYSTANSTAVVKYSLYGDFKAGDDEDNTAIIFDFTAEGGEDVGEHKITDASATSDNYVIGVNIPSSAKLTITQKDITGLWVATVADATYTGSALEPEVTVKEGATVIDASNYSVAYTNNINASAKDGDGVVAFTLTNTNYTGTITSVNFTIAQKEVDTDDLNIADIAAYTYDGTAKEPVLTVKDGSLTLVAGADYTVAYTNNTNASTDMTPATATVTLSATGNYVAASGAVFTKDFTINPLSIAKKANGPLASGFSVTPTTVTPAKIYTGSSISVSGDVDLLYNGTPLVEGTDYEIVYESDDNCVAAPQTVGICFRGLGNFTGVTNRRSKFTIQPRNLAGTITFTDGDSYGYKAADQTPAFTVMNDLGNPLTDADYDVAWTNNKNVGTATLTLTGKGNYASTLAKNFTITPGTLKIQPVPGQYKHLSALDPEFEWEFVEGYGLQGDDEGKADEILSEQPVLTRGGAEDIGTYALTVSNIVSITATNYIVSAVDGTFEIKPAIVFVRVKDDLSKEYGTGVPAAASFEEFFTVSGLLSPDNATGVVFTLKDEEGNALATPLNTGDVIPVGNYTIAITGATTTDDSRYQFDFTDGALEVTKRHLTITADDKAKNHGEDDPALTVTYANFVPGEDESDLVGTLSVVREAGETVGTYTITASGYTEEDNPNYEIEYVPGTLTINALTSDLVLNRVPKAEFENAAKNTAAKLIESHEGATVNVDFKMYNLVGDPATEEEQDFVAEKWYTLVLPFATTVREVSNAFGYAVVDVFKGRTDDDLAKFGLHMGAIEANQPFIVKIDEAKKLADVQFTSKTIVKADPVQEIDGIQFIGTYEGKADGFRADEWYFSFAAAYDNYYKGNDTNKTYLRPLGAYLKQVAGAEVRGLSIEEADGTVTEIRNIAVEENANDAWYSIDGKRLQKPATKGIYIQNGKKVVVK